MPEKHKMQIWIETELENVSKMKKQLTYEQCEKLINEFKSKPEIANVLMQMENFEPLTKKYRSVYLTVRNWMQINRARAPKGASFRHKYSHDEALKYCERHGLPFAELDKHFKPEKDPNGKTYWIKL